MNNVDVRVPTVIAVACMAMGCYNYTSLATVTPEPGTNVALQLTDPGSWELAHYLGPEVFVVRGRYLGESEKGILMSVSSVELRRGDEFSWAGETVTVPVHDVAGVEVRRLARGRSALLLGAGVAAVVATTAAFSLSNSSINPGRSNGTPPTKQ